MSAYIAWAESRRAAGEYEKATEALQAILKREPSNVDALRLMGDIAWDQKEAEEAKKWWLAVRQIQPNDFGANWGLGRMYLQQRRSARAATQYLETARSVVPADEPDLQTEVSLMLAQAYAGDRKTRQAMDLVRQVLSVDPEDYDANYLQVALRTNVAQTEDEYDQALSDAKRLIGIVQRELETDGVTREGVQRLMTAYQTELQVLSSLGNVLFERNADGTFSTRLRPGKEQRAASVISETVDVMIRRADVQRMLAYFDIAEIAAKAVEYDGGTNARTLMDLGLLQKATGQNALAIITFTRVLDIDPLHKEAARQLDELQSKQAQPETWPGLTGP